MIRLDREAFHSASYPTKASILEVYWRMPGSTRSYALDISEELFKLSTESVRLHSNDTLRYQTLAQLLTKRLGQEPALDGHNPENLREFLEKLPTRGSVRIHLNISRTSADSLVDIKKRLSQEIGNKLTVGDAISILLYDYLVERSATRVVSNLRLRELDAERNPET